MSTVADVQSYLAAQGIVDGTASHKSVRGVLNDEMGNKAVAIKNDGGPAPEIGTSEGAGSAAYRDPRVLITVRSDPHKRDANEDKVDEIYNALHGLKGATLGSTEYHRIIAETPPIEVGPDERGRPIHTVAFRMAVSQGAPVVA